MLKNNTGVKEVAILQIFVNEVCGAKMEINIINLSVRGVSFRQCEVRRRNVVAVNLFEYICQGESYTA
jgi:hypothetical protein